MKCSKCSTEVIKDSKFCNNCGKKVSEESVLDIANKGIDMSRKMGYLMGVLRTKGMAKDKKKKWFREFEENLELKIPDFYEDYQRTVKFWKDFVKENKPQNGNKKLTSSLDD